MNGDIIAVILEKSGVFFYQTNTLDLLGELTGSEISAASSALLFWTSYVSIVHRKYIEEEDRYQIYLNVLLSGTDNRLYSYFVGIDVEEVEELAIYDRTVPIEQRTLARGGSGSFKSPMKGRKASFPSPVNPTSTARITTIKYSLTTCFFGYYELPGKVSNQLPLFLLIYLIFHFPVSIGCQQLLLRRTHSISSYWVINVSRRIYDLKE